MNSYLNDIWNISPKSFPTNGELKNKINFILRYAILAPSSHNMQPWLFKLKDNRVEIFLNPKRRLLFSDRTNRQAYISLGCCIANILLASEYFGLNYEIELLPITSFQETAANIYFLRKSNGEISKVIKKYGRLINFINQRKTNRFPHLAKKIPVKVIGEISGIGKLLGVKVEVITDKKEKDGLAEIVGNASYEAFSNDFFRNELSNWVISVYSKRKDGIPLYDFGLPHPLTVFASSLIKHMSPRTQKKN